MTPPAVIHRWWQTGIIYQIYPRSFADTNRDGVGDLAGIRERLPYLESLRIDAIWISPIYPSPMADFGYDISDYTEIHPLFGSLGDFDALLKDAHERGMRVILDFVPNHSSNQHPWFIDSRSDRSSDRREWYIWRDPAPGGGPPTNWRSVFGGSAWTFDPATGQYYYHAFLPEQPDLNWRNPEVERAMLEVLRFWLDRGVDGFRVDVIWHLIKSEQMLDNPPNPDYEPHQSPYDELLPVYTVDQPEVHGIIRTIRELFDAYDGERVLIGEIYLPVGRLISYYGENGGGVHFPYNFQLLTLPWSAREIAAAIDAYEALLPEYAWPNWVLGNHDKSRIATRVGEAQARVAAMMLLTLRGTATIYYGDEIGMTDVPIPPDRVQDPFEKNVPGRGLGRDPERTPMQWDATRHAGFSEVSPWLPIAPAAHGTVNVASQAEDPRSMLALHRRLIELRRAEEALHAGTYSALEAAGDLIAFARKSDGSLFVIVLNLGSSAATYPMPSPEFRGRIELSTHLDREAEPVAGRLRLRPDEGVVIRIG
ncbi:MAG TPA: alpha-amylase family glycosyl hydrolase [Thermoanaerobaculia bacterium]|nr:alpha-amylase family glycosyl hydrolase [Thermoanaerobaculia bacterium]